MSDLASKSEGVFSNPYQTPAEIDHGVTQLGSIVFQLTKVLNRHAESKFLLYQNLSSLTTLSIFAILLSLGCTILVAAYYPDGFLPTLIASLVVTAFAYNSLIKNKRRQVRKTQESLGLVDNVFVSVQVKEDDIEFEVSGTVRRWPLAQLSPKRTEYGLLLIANDLHGYLFVARRGDSVGGSFRQFAKHVIRRCRELQKNA